MQQQEVAIAPVVRVVMESSSLHLDEVIVTGYGVTKKAAFTGAASVLDSENVAKFTDSNPIKSLDGSVSGVQLNVSSGQPGAPANVYIRGRSSLNSGTQPLYVIDDIQFNADPMGVRIEESQSTSPLASLNASDIESITVLKDATATSIYGARAANGVIVITTKKVPEEKPG
ncbi:MAG: TonB-dependent receptor plug domain-containing protein [Tannerellaceae bacterium]|nr:TonB-dependent receptor plug domain-containing protein [Tannerellaceae bacterium]